MEQLGTDSCRGTVPMELPVPNCSMQHREPKSEIDDTRMILQGASCTIAAQLADRGALGQPMHKKYGILYIYKNIIVN